MIPSIWQNDNCYYDDYQMNNLQVKYDRPKIQRTRDHLICKGALFFRKKKNMWHIIGKVTNVHEHGDTFVSLDIEKWGVQMLKTKSDAAVAFGFKPLNESERGYGLIPLHFNEETTIINECFPWLLTVL